MVGPVEFLCLVVALFFFKGWMSFGKDACLLSNLSDIF